MVCSWTLLPNRIPTRVNLAVRHVLNPEASKNCVMCDRREESGNHIYFLNCEEVSKVWLDVMWWLEFNFITPPNLFVHLKCWSKKARTKKFRKGFLDMI